MDPKQIPFERLNPGRTSDSAVKYPDPHLGYERIPASRYTSPAFMKREWERLWTKAWLLGGREEMIPEAGDWMTHEVGTESFIFARQADGSVRGFFNVCPHRGNRIVAKDSVGSSPSFKCGYHHWEWHTDGTQKHIPDLETFPQLPGCVLHLKAVRVDSWGGFFWFTMDADAGSLADWLGEIPAHLDRYGFDRQKLVDWKTIEWDCNWKASVDAFNETYHVQGIHPELLSWLDDYNVQIDCFGLHNRYLVPFTTPSPHYPDQVKLSDVMRAMAEGAGLNADDYEGNPRALRLAIQRAKRAMTDSIYPYAALSDDQLSDDYHYMIFPNVTMNIYAESMLLFVSRPHASDPNKMLYDVMIFGHLAPDTPHMLPEHLTFRHGQTSLGLVLDQDAHNLPRVQEGMNSKAFEGLILGTQELRIRHFHKVLMDFVGEDD
ncbi:aromatic ring-hydroxylating dioxygenase subunit alpha [Sandaracinobacteroides saxicola]|uniref:Aromatic ring-hydroxylating dioxygenase subunit alpha n=1 Tax=Sandaracinobacteroides saxicola TaxID=2759707 RepID=A0A7G5IMP8_9SPHN|nr:aromatic ring-hydroxylating dioxygenase subunit alpha [Sandaracinobacteroides saxicola]